MASCMGTQHTSQGGTQIDCVKHEVRNSNEQELNARKNAQGKARQIGPTKMGSQLGAVQVWVPRHASV